MKIKAAAISLEDLAGGEKLIQYLAQTTNIASLFQRIQTLIHRSGFTHFFFMLLSGPADAQGHFGSPLHTLRASYNEGMYFLDDMVIQHALMSDCPIMFSKVTGFLKKCPVGNRLIQRNKRIAQLLAESRLIDIYSIPFTSCAGRRALFSVSAMDVEPMIFSDQVGRLEGTFKELALAIDVVGHKNFSEHFNNLGADQAPKLSFKPIHLLATLANDNVDLNQAAQRLGISISTANQHIAAAKRALGAQTISSAITRAIKLGLIQIQS